MRLSRTLRQGGTACIRFGTMLRLVSVGAGLRDGSKPQNAGGLSAATAGGAALPARDDLAFVNDEAFVTSRLRRAWSARVSTSTKQEIGD